MSSEYPLIGLNFEVQIGGKPVANFSEVSGLGGEIEVEEYKEGGVNEFVHKLPRLVKYNNLVLKQGTTDSTEIYEWFKKAVVDGKVKEARKSFAVSIFDESNSEKVRWDFEDGFPVKYDAPDLKGQEGAIAIETLEIAIQGMKRTK